MDITDMHNADIIQDTQNYVQHTLKNDSSHDWWHVHRVWKTAAYIAKREHADLFIVEMAALLHDLEDWKFQKDPQDNQVVLVKKWLQEVKVDVPSQKQIMDIIHQISFKGARVSDTNLLSLEGKIVQDADRLDAIGAIGIARTFAYGGYKNREIYNPDIPIQLHRSFSEYKNHQGTTINHFYEKLLLLKEKMNTKTAQLMSKQRHTFMEHFLEQFFKEWNGIFENWNED